MLSQTVRDVSRVHLTTERLLILPASRSSPPRNVLLRSTKTRLESAVSIEDTSASAHEKLHLRYLLVHLLHKLDDKVHQLVLQHLLRMVIRYQERDIIALYVVVSIAARNATTPSRVKSHRHWLPSQDEERFRPLGQKSCELMHKNMLNLIRLFYPDADSYAVD